MRKKLIGSHSVHETLVRQTQIDAARIEELKRFIKEQDALLQELRPIIVAASELRKERDALQADNAELVAALELLSKYIAYNGDDWVQRTALEALAKVRKP